MSERQFQNAVTKLAGVCQWRLYHTHDSRRSNPGFPDLVLVHEKRGVIFAELKTDKGRVSPAQVEWMQTIEKAGGRVYLWRPRDLDAITKILMGQSS